MQRVYELGIKCITWRVTRSGMLDEKARRGSRIFKRRVNFCSNVIEPKPS